MMEKLWGLVGLILGLVALLWSGAVFLLTWAVIAAVVWVVWAALNGAFPIP
jgi:hypothetical protein